MDKIAVIILHYQNNEDTKECLSSLFTNHKKTDNLHTFVVSNSPVNKLSEFIEKKYPQVEILENQDNLGFAQGVNLGIKKALDNNCNYIILLNNDTLLAKDTITQLVSFAKVHQSVGLVSPKIYFAPGFEYHKDRYKTEDKGRVLWYAGGIIDWANIYAMHRGVDEIDKGQFDEVRDTDFATGCCLLIKREVIEQIGLFDEKYFLYFEDIDFSLRAKRREFRVVYFPKAHLWHKNAETSGKPGSALHIYYQTRNRLYFGYKYATFRAKKALFFDSLRLFLKGKIYRKAVADYYLGRMGKGTI